MIKYKLLALYYAFKIATCSCEKDTATGFNNWASEKEIEKTGFLNPVINESSGLVKTQEGKIFTHNDSGGQARVFEIAENGTLLNVVEISAANKDWEDLAADKKGNVYIGDFGNNLNARKDLTIYKWGKVKTESISFSYADQTFTEGELKLFDCEAFFWHNDSLYLFTKSWEKKEQLTKMYVIPDKPGNYTPKPRVSLILHEPVTAADINPSGDHFALLTYGKVLIFEIRNGEISFDNPLACIKTGRKQTEGITFINDSELLISNEQGELFKLKIPLKTDLPASEAF